MGGEDKPQQCRVCDKTTIWPADRPADRTTTTHHDEHKQLAARLAPKYGACDAEQPEDDELAKAPRTLLERAARRIPGLGIIMALCASLFLGTAGMLVKVTHSVHGIQVAVFRAMIQVLVYAFIINLRQLRVWPQRRELLPVAGRAVLGGVSITLSYYALKLIPLGDATTIRFSLPIWTLIIGYFILGEPCNLLKVLAVIVSVSGVVLIAKPDDCIYLANFVWRQLGLESERELAEYWREHEAARQNHTVGNLTAIAAAAVAVDEDDVAVVPLNSTMLAAEAEAALVRQQLEGCLMALGSSICLSLSLISMRLCKQTPTEVIILWLSLSSIALGSATLLALAEWRLPDNLADVLYILLNGLCGSAGQWFITSALKIEQSGVIALARTFDIEVAFLYSALLLHEQIRTTSIVGSVLVSSGVIVVVIPKWLEGRGAAAADSAQPSPTTRDQLEPPPSPQLQQKPKSTSAVGASIARQDSAIGSSDSSSGGSAGEPDDRDKESERRRAQLEHEFAKLTAQRPRPPN